MSSESKIRWTLDILSDLSDVLSIPKREMITKLREFHHVSFDEFTLKDLEFMRNICGTYETGNLTETQVENFDEMKLAYVRTWLENVINERD